MSARNISRWALGEIATLAVVGVLAAWLFEFHPIDMQIAQAFYDPRVAYGWPWASVGWVRFVNDHLITIVTIVGAVASVLLWIFGSRVDKSWRFAGMFLFLSLLVGPGLLVNEVLKAEWGRAVPRDVVNFGGSHAYRHISNPGASGPPERGGEGGSFPSGHASVAFWTSGFYFLLRRKRPRAALVALSGTLAFGALVAFARMAAGRHFISDVVWSGIIVLTMNWLLYHALLRRWPETAAPKAPHEAPKEALSAATPADAG